jgi:tetratricopeptide (TPR) repeat protein
MKKTIITLLATLSLCNGLAAIENTQIVTLEKLVKDPAWQASFAYSFLPNTEIEPKVDGNQLAVIETFKKLKDYIAPEGKDKNGNDLKPDYQGAIKLLEEVIKNGGEDINAVLPYTLGNLYLAVAINMPEGSVTELQKKAVSNYEFALKQFKNYLRAHKSLAQLYMQMDKQAKAKHHFVEAIKLGDRDANTLGVLGYIYFNEEDYVAADTALRQALIIDPENKNFNILLGQSLIGQARWNEANALLSQQLKRDPNNTGLWLTQVTAYQGMDRMDDALINLEVVRRMGAADVQTLQSLGSIYLSKEMYTLATDTYIEALKLNPSQSPDKFITSAKTFVSLAAYDHAINLIETIETVSSSALTPENQTDLSTLKAQIMISTGRGSEAVVELEKVLSAEPMNGEVLLTLATYYSRQNGVMPGTEINYTDKAVLYFERAESLPIDSIKAKAFVRHAQLFVAQKHYADAIPLLKQSINLEKNESVEAFLESVETVSRAYSTN